MKRAITVIIVISLIFALGGCKKAEDIPFADSFEEFDASIEPGGVVEGYLLRSDTFNPLLTKIDSNRDMLNLCYDSLFYLDSSYHTVPLLASSYEISGDGKNVSVELRKDVLWHDGTGFTANDVVYTVNNILSEETCYYNDMLSSLVLKVRQTSTYEVLFTLRAANSGFVNLLTFPILKKVSGRMVAQADDYLPLGTGPFKVIPGSSENVLSLEKNPSWHGGHIYIDGVNLHILPDEEAANSAFSSGLVDFIKITKENAGKISTGENIGNLKLYTPKYSFVSFNFENPLLQKENIRTLLGNMIDKKAFSESVLGNFGSFAEYPFYSQAYFITKDSETATAVDFDLSSFGCEKNQDGKIEYTDEEGNKTELSFSLLVNNDNPFRLVMANTLAESLSDKGIKIYVDPQDFDVYAKKIADGEFDMFIGETLLSPDFSPAALLGSTGKLNYGKYAGEETDKLIARLLAADSVSDRNKYIKQILEDFEKSAPHMPLLFEDEILVYNSKKIGHVSSMPSADISRLIANCCVNK